MGGNPQQFSHAVNFFNKNQYSVALLRLPAHTHSDSSRFRLTLLQIKDYYDQLKIALSKFKDNTPMFFGGVSFGASFARALADEFNAPVVLMAPFITTYHFKHHLLLSSLSLLDKLSGDRIGTYLSTLFPLFRVGSSAHGLSNMYGSVIYESWRYAFGCHYAQKRTSHILLLLSKNDRTISNEAALNVYDNCKKVTYDASHNIYSKNEISSHNLDHINSVIKHHFDLARPLGQLNSTSAISNYDFIIKKLRYLSLNILLYSTPLLRYQKSN